jgi:hypothetical protein
MALHSKGRFLIPTVSRSDKRTSLQCRNINYSCTKFYSTCPRLILLTGIRWKSLTKIDAKFRTEKKFRFMLLSNRWLRHWILKLSPLKSWKFWNFESVRMRAKFGITLKCERFLLNFAKMTWKNLFNICWILLTLIHAMKKGETKADFVQYLNWPTSWVDKGGRSLRKETVWY